MSNWFSYFAKRAAYDTLRAGLRSGNHTTHQKQPRAPKQDFVPADPPSQVATTGMEVLWLRPTSYPVVGYVVRTDRRRGVCITVTKVDGGTTERWVDPQFLTTPVQGITVS